jgi:enediyne biosynthesis protein E4
MNAPPSLLVNNVHNGNHWIAFRVVGAPAATRSAAKPFSSSRDAIGARITVKAGTRTFVDEVRSGSSFISSSDMRVHFGLGAVTKIDSAEVRWPSGLTERFSNVSIDAINVLKEGAGTSAGRASPSKP